MMSLALSTMTLAQTQAPATNPEGQQQNAETPRFLNQRSPSDLFASAFVGHARCARHTQGDTAMSGDGKTMSGTQPVAMMNRSDLGPLDNIGQIDEIALSSDGQVRALVVGVGGLFGRA
ncbi:hypothetical protein [Paracoccus salsus]|uniref:hypothetical protein n=1 Tax=Paracoccus salsus TaxID=2911061 RepID=UPI001F16A770|nr:hypothetical protein [Paracoccus salsus]MCF3974985.1 hypothetical protein [Paracoccus salsus]